MSMTVEKKTVQVIAIKTASLAMVVMGAAEMTSIALYQLAGKYQQLAERLANMDLDATTIADTIESTGLPDEIAQKGAGIEMVARTFEMHVPAIDAEIARLTALKTSCAKKAQGLRDYLKANMLAMGIDKIETPLFKIRLQNNPPTVEIYEPGLIPAKYMTHPVAPPPAPDKTAIKTALKAGFEVQGAKLNAGVRLVVN